MSAGSPSAKTSPFANALKELASKFGALQQTWCLATVFGNQAGPVYLGMATDASANTPISQAAAAPAANSTPTTTTDTPRSSGPRNA